jgi:hypothetical protein
MIIGITGKKRSGKDTAGSRLHDKYNFKRYSFADPIKKAAMEMFDFDTEQMWGSTKEVVDPRWGISPREVLQILGTELFQYDIHKHTDKLKHIGRDIWAFRFKIWRDKHPLSNVVITDVRFPHEVKIIRELGGQIWKVVRPSLADNDNHASEREMDSITDIDITIVNDGSIDKLYKAVDECYEHKMLIK